MSATFANWVARAFGQTSRWVDELGRLDRPPVTEGPMTKPTDPQEEIRKEALTAFLEAKIGDGFRIETRTDTHAIIVA